MYASRLKMTGASSSQPVARETFKNRIIQFFKTATGLQVQVDFDKLDNTFTDQVSARDFAIDYVNRLAAA